MKSYINTHDENISQEFGHLRGLRLPYYRQFLSSPIMRELLKKLNWLKILFTRWICIYSNSTYNYDSIIIVTFLVNKLMLEGQ